MIFRAELTLTLDQLLIIVINSYSIILNVYHHLTFRLLAVRTFRILWCGQMASAIGTEMTQFALTLWIWQLTQETTALALLSFFFQVPQILLALLAGLAIDRFNRRYLLIFSDLGVALATIVIGLLHATHNLHLWHLYLLAIAYGCGGQIQELAFSASIPLIVSKQHYTQVSSMRTLVGYSSVIIAPALVGSLYSVIGLIGIIGIDLVTFMIGVAAVLMVQIPQPQKTDIEKFNSKTIGQQLFWGIHYIWVRPSLLAMTVIFCCFLFTYQMSETLYQPMILARTGGDAQLLSQVVIAAGIGGGIGAVSLSILGGFQRRVNGMLIGLIGVGLGGMLLGLSQTQEIWIGAKFFAALNIPLVYSSSYAVWYAKVRPEVQGRVLAAAHTVGLIVGAIASLMAGLLADRVFEPAIGSNRFITSIFAPILGTEFGAGITLLFIMTSISLVAIGLSGYAFPLLRNAEELLPDHDGE